MRLYILKTTGAFVQGPGNLNPAVGNFRLKLATQEPLEVQYLNAAGAAEPLPTGQLPYLGVKALSHYDDVFVALSDPLTAPGSASGFYTGNLNCNTTEFAGAIGDNAGSTAAENDSVPLMGEVVVPVDGSGNLSRSQTFPITGANRVVTGEESVPVSANPPYPPPDQVDTIAARNTAIAAAVGALPAPVDTSEAPIQPFPLFLQYGGRLSRISGGYTGITLALSGIGMTYVSPAEVVAWLVEAIYFIQPNLGSAPITIDLSSNALTNTGDILDAIAAAITQAPFTSFGGGITVLLDGGLNAAPLPVVAHQDATLSLQLPAPTPDNAGEVLQVVFAGATCQLVYDAGIAFAASNVSGSQTTTIGVSDSPTMQDVTSYLDSAGFLLFLYYFINLAADGSATGIDPTETDYPIAATGPAVVSYTPGVVAVPNASIAAITAYNGSTVTTN